MRNPKKRRKPPKTPWGQWLRFIEEAEGHPLTKAIAAAIAVLSVWVLLETLGQIRADLKDRVEEREARMQERVDRAWTRMRTRSGGDIGKGWAVNVLIRSDSGASELDLSCKANGGYDNAAGECTAAPVYRGIDLYNIPDIPGYGDIRPWFLFEDATDATFVEANFDSTLFTALTKIDDTKFINSTFVGSDWSPVFFEAKSRALITSSDVSFARFGNPEFVLLTGSNISGAVFSGAYPGRKDDPGNNWAWADYPPKVATAIGLDVVPNLEIVRLCDPSLRKRGGQSGRPLAPFGFSVKDDVTGISPQVRDDHSGPGCREMTAEEARAAYPSSYKPSGQR